MRTFSILITLSLLTLQCSAQLCDRVVDEEDYSPQCLKQLKIVCNNGSVLWRMFDASSKYPISGMSYGSNRDLGNFDQCINLNYESEEGNVKGKFCALNVAIVNILLDAIPNPWSMDLKPRALVENPKIKYTYNSNMSEHVRATTNDYLITLLSICVPDACTPKEVGKFFIWGDIFNIENINLVNFVETVPCITKESNTDFKWGDTVFIVFLGIILLLIVCSTAYDFFLQKFKRKTEHPVFLAFSLITNVQKLLNVDQSNPEQIQCLNGIRFISMMWVIAGHGFVALESVPLINYSTMPDYEDKPYVQYIASAPIAVDTFFFLSGLLLTYGYLKAAAKMPPIKQLLGFPMMVLHRYLRLTPALAVAYFASITIFRMTGTGPLWDAAATPLREQCEKHWWSFFLYVQNYVNYDDLCWTHTWYLSADMQMFVLSPLVLIPITILVKRDKTLWVLYGLTALTAICVGFPMLIRFLDHDIANVYDTHSRLNDYLIGVILGVILRKYKSKPFPFSKLVNLTIWCAVLVICVSFNLAYHSILRVYDHTSDTLFYGLYRPVWCASLAWMVYSCHHGYGGPINWFLSLPVFLIGARLSYCMYLLHAIVEMYWVGIARTPYYWADYINFYVWCGHFIVTIILSTVWTLAFESPMIVIERFLFGGTRKRKGGTAS